MDKYPLDLWVSSSVGLSSLLLAWIYQFSPILGPLLLFLAAPFTLYPVFRVLLAFLEIWESGGGLLPQVKTGLRQAPFPAAVALMVVFILLLAPSIHAFTFTQNVNVQGLRLATDKSVYLVGEVIMLRLFIVNESNSTLTLS